MEQIYLVFIRPLLESGDIIWDNCQQSEKQELKKNQIEAARIATDATKLVSIAALYRETRWDSLDERRRKHKLTLFYKMTNALSPLYLSSLVPLTVSNALRYNLRNSSDLQTVEARTSLFYNSFLPSTVRARNSLPSTAKQTDSTNSFKYFLNKDKDSTPKYYYAGSRKAQIFHTRLRTNCSSLKLDFFLKNMSDFPLCLCGSVEDAKHFFFHCGNYQLHRTVLLDAVSQYQTPSLNLLLYGDKALSPEINRTE